LFGLGTLLAYMWFTQSAYFPTFLEWSERNIVLYYFILIFSKIIGIIWPPIPGGVFTLGSIPVLGWLGAYIADLAGSMIGSTIAYLLAKKYGLSFMKNIFDDEIIEKIKRLRVNPKHEIESIFVFRIFGGNVMELFCYGAGLLRVNFFKYILASFAAHLTIGIPTFYLIRNILSGKGILISIGFFITLVFLFFTLKHRYFEIEKTELN